MLFMRDTSDSFLTYLIYVLSFWFSVQSTYLVLAAKLVFVLFVLNYLLRSLADASRSFASEGRFTSLAAISFDNGSILSMAALHRTIKPVKVVTYKQRRTLCLLTLGLNVYRSRQQHIKTHVMWYARWRCIVIVRFIVVMRHQCQLLGDMPCKWLRDCVVAFVRNDRRREYYCHHIRMETPIVTLYAI